ncbi:LOW QUALITY PROTEIN: rho GTPase-activating protein 7 [Lampris incognitus]|uniref:LOW QUALITY PROTEIN: rho GTPase-activating protein 7 n=1 Tax=Lampris incognitus TaxID=2546036 RepID=UPI0024B5A24A|nr:LOW QUALITY PROTEIN: rho GTPase-activating protein 7 [Lampris incognitus]
MLITKIEAKEACDWLRAAGFPQYVQLFKDGRFPIDIDWAKNDHHFLDKDALDSVCRRLNTLNRCVEMRLEPRRSKRRGEDCDPDDDCAISPRWTFDRRTQRWRRLRSALDLNDQADGLAGRGDVSPCDVSDRHEVCSLHSTSSAESDAQESSRCSSSTNKSLSLDRSFSGSPLPQTRRGGGGGSSSTHSLETERCFPEKTPRKKGHGLLRKMEKLRLVSALLPPAHNGSSGSGGDGVAGTTGSPAHLRILPHEAPKEEDQLREMQCLKSTSTSPSESSSAVSTPSPVTRVRSNWKHSNHNAIVGDGPSHNRQDQQNHRPLPHRATEDHKNQINNNDNSHESLVFQIPRGHKPGTFPTSLTHKDTILSSIMDSTSVNWRTGSFHGCGGGRARRAVSKHSGLSSSSSLEVVGPSPLTVPDHRISIYDNVPAQQVMEMEESSGGNRGGSGTEEETEIDHMVSRLMSDEEILSALDSVMTKINDLQQLVSSWTPLPRAPHPPPLSLPCLSSLDHIHLDVQGPDDGGEHGGVSERRHWSSEQTLSSAPPGLSLESQSVSSLQLLQKLSLLKLTTLMDRFSPSCKQGCNWTVPKPLRKTKGSEMKGRRVFGVSLLHNIQQTGESLPPSILGAMTYLKTQCLDQVGLFRKSGVKTRIQYLRDLVESDPDGVSYDGQSAFDVADMVKQYFRDLPEPVFTSSLCQSFLHIYQYFPKDQQLVAVQAAILLLPDENREALQTLLLFLRDVVACVEENQMTPTNIAVCLAPSLFHLNTQKRDANATRSGHRKYSLGCPGQRDLSENLAATQGLAHMVSEAPRLFQLPDFWLGWCERAEGSWEEAAAGPAGGVASLQAGEEMPPQERRSRLEENTQRLLKEARERSKDWESHAGPSHVELSFKKMDDGCPLWMWRGCVEVEAPQKELLHLLLREQELREGGVSQAGVIRTLSENTDVYRFLLRDGGRLLGCRPPQEHLLLRTWQSDPSSGFLYISSVSTEQQEVLVEGVRVEIYACLYLLEPLGDKRTRVTHLYRTDTRGRSQEWYSKVAGHRLAFRLLAIRDSFRPEQSET